MKHGGIILFASFLSFFFGYLFHSYMGRNLGPEDYGIFDAVLSLFLIILIPASTIQAVVARFSSIYIGTGREGCINLLMSEGFKKLLGLGLSLFILLSILSPFISDFLRITTMIPIILLGVAILLALILPVSRGVLQGIQNFNHFGLNISMEKLILLLSGVSLIGFGVTGAILSLIISQFLALLISFIPVRKIKNIKPNKALRNAIIIRYSIPVLISLSAIAVMSNVDMLIVKHYFDPAQAGGYATVNIMGKFIFLLSFNVANVIYPKVSELYVQKKESVFLLKKGLFYMAGFSLVTIILFALFPEHIMNMIFGPQYLKFANLLAPYSVVMTIYAFVVIIVYYNLSTMNFIHTRSLIFFAIMELILLTIFHESLIQVIEVNLISSMVLLAILFKNFLQPLSKTSMGKLNGSLQRILKFEGFQ